MNSPRNTVDHDAWVRFRELPRYFNMSERWIRVHLLTRSDFPKPVRIGARSSVWRAGDLLRFRASVFEARPAPGEVVPVQSQSTPLITR